MAYNQDFVAGQIKDSVIALLSTRKEISIEIDREGNNDHKEVGKNTFSDADEEWGAGGRVGLMASMQGIRTIFNSLAALDKHAVNIWDAVLPKQQDGAPPIYDLLDEWASCLNQLDEDGYHADPYDDGEDLSEIFNREDCPSCYIDTVAWVVSTCVLVNYVIKTRGGELLSRTTESGLLDRTRQRLRSSLQVLLDAQTADGGWGWWPKSARGHLIFTWSAVGSIADIYDCVLGESEQEIDIGPDMQMKEYLLEADPGILTRLQQSRQKASNFLSQRYLKAATTSQGLQQSDVSEDDILVVPNDPLTMVFCDLYLLEALILVDYHERHEDRSGSREDELELLFSQIVGKLPRIKDAKFARNTDATQLEFQVTSNHKRQREFIKFTAMDGGLWAQLLRTLVLYRFYVKKDPLFDPNIVGEKGSALRLLLDARRTSEAQYPGLWDLESFNLAISARAIDGLVDCFDYFDLQHKLHHSEHPSISSPIVQDGLATAITEAIYPLIEQRIQTSLQVGELSSILTSITDNMPADLSGDGPTPGPMQSEGDRASLRKEIESAIRQAVIPKVLDIIGDATYQEWLPARGEVSPDWVAKTLLGSKAEIMRTGEGTEQAYQLLSMLAWLSFNVGVRLWSTMLQEVVVEWVPQEAKDEFRSKIAHDGPGSLAERLQQVMMALADIELKAADGSDEDRPSYRKIAESLVLAKNQNAAPVVRAGRKG